MNVLVTGGAGYLGPFVARSLAREHRVLLSDVKQPAQKPEQEFRVVDMTSLDQVMRASEGMDAIVNCSVVRESERLAFAVNSGGCWNMMTAAVRHGIKRILNTGPHFTVTGPPYEGFDFGMDGDIPPQSSTILYALTKSLGHEVCRVFSEHHDIHVLNFLFYNFRDLRGAAEGSFNRLRPGSNPVPFVVSGDDAAKAIRLGLTVDKAKLPSRSEVFLILTDMPHGKFRNDKAKRILGWRPKDDISALWRKV
ncbi:MAG: NAD(P)-dependent oxidoreductase [Acidobacteria bacterium]|nr:NAD(P)-dependent oxidoreductase [Acidobacteriota bacterium]